MNVHNYSERIGINDILEPTAKSLKKLQSAHLFNIPFENLDIHYGNKIELEISKLYKKVVTNGRGGFCYELNGLFYELLTSLGFNVKRISARVYSEENGYGKEFDHLALIVNIDDEEYLADVGFGEFTLEPLKFELAIKQKDKNGIFFFDKYDNEYFRINKLENDVIIPQYIFKTESRELDDFSGMCTYHQNSKNSHFTQKRVITLPTEKGRIALNSDKLRIRSADKLEEILLTNKSDFNKYLLEYFHIEKV